jgi:hypothetical protein
MVTEAEVVVWWESLSNTENKSNSATMLKDYISGNPWKSATWIYQWAQLKPTQQLMIANYYRRLHPR